MSSRAFQIADSGSFQNNVVEKLPFGKWRIERDTYQFLGEICQQVQPQNVLEFGAGLSTLLFADQIAQGHIHRLHSIEHLQTFDGHPGREIEKKGLGDRIQIHHRPIQLRTFLGEVFEFYNIRPSELEDWGPFDLVFVDGPPYYFGGREAVLYAIYPYLRKGSLILMDDANRKNYERRYLKRWEAAFGDQIHTRIFSEGFKKGLSITECLIDPTRPTPKPVSTRSSNSIKRTSLHYYRGLKSLVRTRILDPMKTKTQENPA